MSDGTKIEWSDATWNPVTGCTKVSPGCDHCYAETMHERFNGKGSFATVTLAPHRLAVPLSWRKPRRVFVNSMSDLFHDDIPDEYIAQVFAVMAACPQHTFQVLTKRHARMRSLLNRFLADRLVSAVSWDMGQGFVDDSRWPLPNVWLGVSTEDQKWADIRIPALLETPAAVRWISAEPLLGPIDIVQAVNKLGWLSPARFRPGGLDWVVAGGESGPGARPMDPQWARLIRDRCVEADVPFLFKQWGAHDVDGKRVGKGRAGRVLDGRTWDEYPAAAS
jgi:protein gp37